MLLFSQCGGCGCGNSCYRCNGNMRKSGYGCREERNNDCGCARETAREALRDAKEAVRDAREAVRDAREQCDGSPSSWQDYPPMPRRESKHEDCGCN